MKIKNKETGEIFEVLQTIERPIIPVKKFYLVNKDGQTIEYIEDTVEEINETAKVKASSVKKSRVKTDKGTK